MDPAGLADQEPTAWLRPGIGRDRTFADPKLYPSRGTAEAIREQSRQRFGLVARGHRACSLSASGS